MDTVSMLNKMRFYCQPILPLVYDESMSYYETLCKVVGQLNTTGETVNKLNEGLTGEISDRQAADAELDERMKLIEATNAKIHFLVFDGANPNGVFPTRHELYQWVEAGDAIFTLLGTYEEGRGQIYAASCSYNAGNWGSEASNDFSIIVPIETSYDATSDYAVKQKVAKLTIPPIPQTNLNVPWGLQIIEVNTPHTSAEGIVNFSATVDNKNTVHANLSPAEFTYLYRAVSKGSGLIVGVNAQLTTNDSQLLLSTTADIIGGETASDDEVRIVFDAETYTGERGLDLPYLNRLIYILSGSGTAETWTLTEFETRDFAFGRDEGFQFTRAANNVITPSFGSTPKEVAEYFGTVKGGTPYQNLPVHLIDEVDNAEYWNGVFDIKDDKHMTFTFVTSNYDAASGKMAVRVIELSADANTTVWKYAEKEFELPLNISNSVVTYTASKVGEGEYKAAAHKTEYQVDFAEGVPAIITSIEEGNRVILRVDLKEPGSELGATPLYFASGYTRIDLFSNAISYVFSGSISNGHYTLELNSGLTHATLTDYGEVLPEPNPDGTDNGKVPTVNGNKWELKMPTGGGSTNAVLYTPQTLTDEQKKQARENVGAVGHNSPQFQGYVTLTPANAPIGTGVGLSPTGSGNNFTLNISDVNEDTPTLLTGVKTPTDTDTNAAATVEYVNAKVASSSVPKPLTYDYMPDGYPKKSVQTVTLMEEQELAFSDMKGVYAATAPVKIELSEGQTYTVVWDGVEYSCVCHTSGPFKYIGNPEALDDESTGEPFLYSGLERLMWVSYDTSTSHTIKVTTISTAYQTIDEKYLPESAFTNAEWSKISNKIVDYKQQSLSLSASGEQINIIAGASYSENRINDKLKFEDGMAYKINGSITIHSPSAAGGIEHTLSVNGNYTCSRGLVKFGSVYANYYRKDIELGLYSSSSDDTTQYGYFYVSSALPGSTTWTFDINITVTGEAKPLPDICIGKNIQRVGDDIIISSSTPDSDKKFRITVDDSGTISATEVM